LHIPNDKLNDEEVSDLLMGESNLIQTSSKMGISSQHLGHSILIVGWKKETDPLDQSVIDVWICRNSYGLEFGMGGDFYVRMGQDDFGIESEVHAYEVESMSS
jgi:C1A family cysteine protease